MEHFTVHGLVGRNEIRTAWWWGSVVHHNRRHSLQSRDVSKPVSDDWVEVVAIISSRALCLLAELGLLGLSLWDGLAWWLVVDNHKLALFDALGVLSWASSFGIVLVHGHNLSLVLSHFLYDGLIALFLVFLQIIRIEDLIELSRVSVVDMLLQTAKVQVRLLASIDDAVILLSRLSLLGTTSLLWVTACYFRFDLVANLLSHMSHLWGFSPQCYLTCLFRLEAWSHQLT